MRLSVRLCALAVAIFACLAYLSTSNTSSAQTQPVTNGQVLISELRYRGPNGIRDEFIEIYNNTDNDIFVQASDASGGWAVFTSDGNITGPVCNIPNQTLIPARGHFLCANTDPDFGSGYSLSGYPSGNPNTIMVGSGPTASATPTLFAPTTPDQSFIIDDLPDGFGVALFSTQSGTNLTTQTRLDAFGFPNSPPLFRESTGFPTIATANNEHTYYRDLRSGRPQDTNNNRGDFLLVATTQTIQISRLGAPGPENLQSPVQRDGDINMNFLDPTVGASSPPNRERRPNVEPNANLGVMLIRRTFTNNTGAPVTRLRFRVINITTRGTPASECGGTPCADLRALTSNNIGQAGLRNGTLTTVRGVRLEADPPITPEGGGYNSSLSADYINLNRPLDPGFSVNIEFKLGIMQEGPFRFIISVEGQNEPSIVRE